MKRNEIAYSLAVLAFAAAFVTASVSKGVRLIGRGSGTEPFRPTAGEPRDVDLRKLERLLRSRQLSEKEALHYKRVEEGD